MSELQLIPQSWFSWKFDVTQAGTPIAKILGGSSFKEKGTLVIGDVTYEALREHLLGGQYLLQQNGQPIASAKKPSALKNSFLFEYAGHSYTLQKESVLGRTFQLVEANHQVGLIKPEGIFTRKANISLPNELPLPVQLFAVWMVLVIWKRENSAAGHGA